MICCEHFLFWMVQSPSKLLVFQPITGHLLGQFRVISLHGFLSMRSDSISPLLRYAGSGGLLMDATFWLQCWLLEWELGTQSLPMELLTFQRICVDRLCERESIGTVCAELRRHIYNRNTTCKAWHDLHSQLGPNWHSKSSCFDCTIRLTMGSAFGMRLAVRRSPVLRLRPPMSWVDPGQTTIMLDAFFDAGFRCSKILCIFLKVFCFSVFHLWKELFDVQLVPQECRRGFVRGIV